MTEKIIDRIRKMLAIANDLAATEAERDTALNMAYKTMAKYNLDMTEIGAKKVEEPRDAHSFDGFSFPFAKSVCNSTAELFFCWYFTGYKINGTQCVHRFVGKESNAATAMVMADWLIKSIMKEGRKYYKQNTSPECRSFCLGAAAKLRQRVADLRREATNPQGESGSRALVLVNLYESEEKANEAFALATFDIKFKKSRGSSIADGDAYNKGKDFASKLNLNLQVGSTSKTDLMVK